MRLAWHQEIENGQLFHHGYAELEDEAGPVHVMTVWQFERESRVHTIIVPQPALRQSRDAVGLTGATLEQAKAEAQRLADELEALEHAQRELQADLPQPRREDER